MATVRARLFGLTLLALLLVLASKGYLAFAAL